MGYEVLVKRTIYVSECEHKKDIKESNPPKERFCDECNKWIPYKEESWTGPQISKLHKETK